MKNRQWGGVEFPNCGAWRYHLKLHVSKDIIWNHTKSQFPLLTTDKDKRNCFDFSHESCTCMTRIVTCTNGSNDIRKWVMSRVSHVMCESCHVWDTSHSYVRHGSFVNVTIHAAHLRRGWAFLEQTRILSGIQYTRYFIEFDVVETKRFVGSNKANVILTWQICGQRSMMSA